MKNALKQMLVPLFKWYYRDRGHAVRKELQFWDQWIRTRGGSTGAAVFARALDPTAEVDHTHRKYLTAPGCRILEVGSGPLTLFGFRCRGAAIDLTPTDYLADEYNALLRQHGVRPVIETRPADACELKEFADETYDYVFAGNCIDHTQDPARAIGEMLRVAKPGGVVFLINREREADHEFWQGMHQWNFVNENGDLVIEGKDSRENVTQRFADRARIVLETKEDTLFVEVRKASRAVS